MTIPGRVTLPLTAYRDLPYEWVKRNLSISLVAIPEAAFGPAPEVLEKLPAPILLTISSEERAWLLDRWDKYQVKVASGARVGATSGFMLQETYISTMRDFRSDHPETRIVEWSREEIPDTAFVVVIRGSVY